MNFVCSTSQDLAPALYDELASFRYQVFVERLGWELPARPGCERDQFDRPDTIHLVARAESGAVIGCGRLLPTTETYLLEGVFPHLLNGLPVPRSEQIWELSRFAIMEQERGVGTERFLAERVLLTALRFCAARGVTHLLAVSTLPVERLMQRAGVELQRLGPPMIVGGQPVLAFVIGVNERSIDALASYESAALAGAERPNPPRHDGSALLGHLAAAAASEAATVH